MVEREEDEEDDDRDKESKSSSRYSLLEDEGERWRRIWIRRVKSRSLWNGREVDWSLTGFLIGPRFRMEATSQHI